MDLVTGIIEAESGHMTEEDFISFVKEHKTTLCQLQGSWQRTIYDMEEEGLL